MKSIILFTTRPVTSKYTKSLIEQMAILKEYQDEGYNIIYVSPKSSNRNIEQIEKIAGIKINKFVSYIDHYKEDVFTKKYSTWKEYVENVSLFDDLQDVHHIVCFGGILSDATKLTRKDNNFNKIFNTWQQMNFTANGTFITGLLQLIKLSRERHIPFHEICYDPCENSVSQLIDYLPYKYYCYHGYDWPEYGLRRLDSLQYYVLNKKKENVLFEDDEKNLDICFGFTALTKDREDEYDLIMNSFEKNKNLKKKLYVRHKALDIDTFVDRDTYLDSIKKSKYTLIIPPYDKKHFSIYRFIESIYNDCLPLIINDTYIRDFVKSFEIQKEKIEQIIVSYDMIGDCIVSMSEEKRIELLKYFKDVCLNIEKKLYIGEDVV